MVNDDGDVSLGLGTGFEDDFAVVGCENLEGAVIPEGGEHQLRPGVDLHKGTDL